MKPVQKTLGFTLIEVLIGLTLLGFILAALYSGLYVTTRTWEAGTDQAQANDDYRLVLSFIRAQVNQAVPLIYLDGENNHVIFEGSSDSITFISPLPSHRGGAGLYMVSFQVRKETGDQSSLVFNYVPLTPGFIPYQESTERVSQVLIKDTASISLEYFGTATSEEEPGWHAEWKRMDRLPDMIRMQIIAAEPDITWPELYLKIPSHSERGQPQMVITRTGNI